MEPNQNPNLTPLEEPTAQPIEPTEPQLTAQVDNLMTPPAASVALETEQTPETPETVPSPELAVSETPAPEVITPSQTAESALAVLPTASFPTESGSPVAAEPIVDTASTGSVASKRSWKKPALLAIAILVAVAVIATAVFAEVIVPNRPDYVLMKSLENSLQQKQVSYKGSINLDSSGTATKIGIAGVQDNDKQAADIQLNLVASGISLPVEARLVDKNAYLKVGDLTPIISMLSAFGGGAQATATYTAIGQQLSNKWVSVDSTLLKQAGISCVTDTQWSLTQSDVKLIEDQYKQHPFGTIQSTASDTINGQKVVKYQLSLDDDKAVAYGSNLNHLSMLKALNQCNKSTKPSTSTTENSLRDHDKTPLTVWVNKGTKQIVQIASESTAQDAKNGLKGSGQISFSYNPVSVIAPSDSTPVLEVLANIEKTLGVPQTGGSNNGLNLSNLLGGLGGSSLQTANRLY